MHRLVEPEVASKLGSHLRAEVGRGVVAHHPVEQLGGGVSLGELNDYEGQDGDDPGRQEGQQ